MNVNELSQHKSPSFSINIPEQTRVLEEVNLAEPMEVDTEPQATPQVQPPVFLHRDKHKRYRPSSEYILMQCENVCTQIIQGKIIMQDLKIFSNDIHNECTLSRIVGEIMLVKNLLQIAIGGNCRG